MKGNNIIKIERIHHDMTGRERTLAAVAHKPVDRVPANFMAVDEVWDKLLNHFSISDREDLLQILQIDCRYITPTYVGTQTAKSQDNTYTGFGGSTYRDIQNEYGTYSEVVKYVLESAQTIENIDSLLKLTDLNSYDYTSITRMCEVYDDYALIAGYASCFYHSIQVYNMEDFLINMIINPEFIKHIIQRITQWNLAFNERILKAGGGRIDFLHLADDFASQRGPLISTKQFNEFFRPSIEAFISLAKRYDAQVYFHCCGSAYTFLPTLIEMGVSIFDPVQTTGANMDPFLLKTKFGDKICFHGGVESQSILSRGTPEDVRKNVEYLVKTLGQDSGYILSSCHAIQAEVPVANILALFETHNRIV